MTDDARTKRTQTLATAAKAKSQATLRDALEQAHGENLDLRRELARRGGPRQTK
ncbi:hypothetical protein ACF07Y_38755 [Streptomyces sp. NPDC016566]|uniref:hypothetical protein n=1 Tax=Streptomyces sp. NPDC016566 TaxID=3364967 RepID=UPI0036FC8E61